MGQDAVIGQELGKLQTHIQKLTAEIKAKQVQLKGLTDDVGMAQAQATLAIQAAKDATATLTQDLRKQVAPLQEQVSTLQTQQRTAEQARETRLKAYDEETSTLKRERNSALADVERQIAATSARLTTLQHAIDLCKQKVATL